MKNDPAKNRKIEGSGCFSNDNNIIKNEIIKELYENLSSEIRTLEKNYISLILPLLTTFGLFGLGIKDFLSSPSYKSLILFSLTTTASIGICIIIFFSSNIFAYTHRSNQKVLSVIEQKFRLYDEILPNEWNLRERLDKCSDADPPEIYKFFRCLSLILIFTKSFIYFVLLFSCRICLSLEASEECNSYFSLCHIIHLIPVFCMIFIMLFFGFLWFHFGWSEYDWKLKWLFKNNKKIK